MNIIVTGSLGHISKPLTRALIQQGHSITVVSSNRDKAAGIKALGATPAIGSVTDAAFLSEIFAGADAAYGMTPPNFSTAEMMAYYREVATAYGEAARHTQLKHLVYLSSYGAHLSSGSGVILGSHYGEAILNQLTSTAVTLLRPGYFYYNLNNFMGTIKTNGMIGSNYGGGDKLIMVSPLDIAEAAAEELTNNTPASKIRYIVSDEQTCSEVAAAIGQAIGKPGLQWLTFTDEQVSQSMTEQGMPPTLIKLLVELGSAIRTGILGQDYEVQRPPMAKVKMAEYVQEFAAVYHQS